MKTVPIEISNARSIEDAMEKAIEQAESGCFTRDKEYKQTHRLSKVTFKTLEVDIEYRDNHWVYKFEAELEEL